LIRTKRIADEKRLRQELLFSGSRTPAGGCARQSAPLSKLALQTGLRGTKKEPAEGDHELYTLFVMVLLV
jgi:hypothetical protein